MKYHLAIDLGYDGAQFESFETKAGALLFIKSLKDDGFFKYINYTLIVGDIIKTETIKDNQ